MDITHIHIVDKENLECPYCTSIDLDIQQNDQDIALIQCNWCTKNFKARVITIYAYLPEEV